MVVPLENAIASVWSVIAKHIQEEPDFKVHAQGPLALSSLSLECSQEQEAATCSPYVE